jgi:quercetin dioxygenase-like cupin family protein
MCSRRGARLYTIAMAVILQAGTASVVGGQARTAHEGAYAPFECADCKLLAKYEVPAFPDAPLFWHVATFPSRDAAESAKGQISFVVDAESRVWLYTFGPKNATPKRGSVLASVGPLLLPPAKSYEIVAYFVVMPARTRVDAHTHSGPEAWYVLAGAQCLETPAGVMRRAAGQGMIAPYNTPMVLTNPGPGVRRALFIVIHDASQPWMSDSDWKPSGACER